MKIAHFSSDGAANENLDAMLRWREDSRVPEKT